MGSPDMARLISKMFFAYKILRGEDAQEGATKTRLNCCLPKAFSQPKNTRRCTFYVPSP
jgi:hypothetical protein